MANIHYSVYPFTVMACGLLMPESSTAVRRRVTCPECAKLLHQQSCGHPITAIVVGNDGTHYCRECAAAARSHLTTRKA